MQVPVYNLAGEEVKKIKVSDHVFGTPFKQAVVHQVMVAQRANARQGTASTKTRAEVTGSSRKLFRQKGTGNARMGNNRSPIRRGGGITFGPRPRDYSQTIPKKMRQLALRCVLSDKVQEKELMVIEELTLDEPKTSVMATILAALGVNSSALIVTASPEENVIKSARNLQRIKTTPASLLNVVDVLSFSKMLITVDAVRKAEELWGDKPVKGGDDASVSGVETSVNN